MKTFKQHIRQALDKKLSPNLLSWDGSTFSEMRNKKRAKGVDKAVSKLSWKGSSFAELRGKHRPKAVQEAVNKELPTVSKSNPQNLPELDLEINYKTTLLNKNRFGVHYDARHDLIEPEKLSQDQREAIGTYTSTGGDHKKINNYYRHVNTGNPDAHGRVPESENSAFEEMEPKHFETVKHLKSAFSNKSNTNRAPFQVWSGVPEHIGNTLQKAGSGSQHELAAFTSASTHVGVGHSFGTQHVHPQQEGQTQEHVHMLKIDMQPHSGMSVAHHSREPESEVLFHPNTKLTYHGSKEHIREDHEVRALHGFTSSREDKSIMVHHVTMHPYEPLD